MYSVFPKFSGRVRGKPDAVPPAHTIQSRGRCQIEIGPHRFPETSFYEVQYLPPAPVVTPTYATWQASYNNVYAPYRPQTAPTPVVQHSTSPLLSSLTSVTTITPTLINHVNAAASSNPTLANLLQLAAAGRASAEQLKTLGLLIQSLATPESSEALSSAATLMKSSAQPYSAQSPPQPAAAYAPVASPAATKEFDLVFQYHETSYERWVLPRGPVICEKVADTRTSELTYDIVLTLALQLPAQPKGPAEADAEQPSQQVVSIRLKRPPPAIWEMIWKWVGGDEKLKENRVILDKLKKQTDRVYLAHRLSDNSLLTQLQNATASSHQMKPLKPGPVVVPRARRKPAQRKPPQNIPPPQTPASAPVAQASASISAVPRPAAVSTPSAPVIPAVRSNNSSPPNAKRQKLAKPKPVATPINQMRCVSCQQTDVPLILGGRYCRPCVDAGKATIYVPYRPPQQAPVVQSTSSTSGYTPSPLGASASAAIAPQLSKPQQ
ncbi:hypothetical protein C8J57DRAFT_16777 [Mycena rebaudengoi]|nr:hypothetical protein C8J57DRAFT_16777 [Mycena rebaudengoi]